MKENCEAKIFLVCKDGYDYYNVVEAYPTRELAEEAIFTMPLDEYRIVETTLKNKVDIPEGFVKGSTYSTRVMNTNQTWNPKDHKGVITQRNYYGKYTRYRHPTDYVTLVPHDHYITFNQVVVRSPISEDHAVEVATKLYKEKFGKDEIK